MRNFGTKMWRRIGDYDRVFLPNFINSYNEQIKQEQSEQNSLNKSKPILVKVFYSDNDNIDFSTVPPNDQVKQFLQKEKIYDILLNNLVMNENKFVLRQRKYVLQDINLHNINFTIDYRDLL